MIKKSGNRFSEKIMLKQKDENMIRSNRIMFEIKTTEASATCLRSCFGAASVHQCEQFVAVMFELLVADAGDATELCQRCRARRRDAVQGCIVEYDIGRHAALARDLGTPRPQNAEQSRIAGFSPSGRSGCNIAAP